MHKPVLLDFNLMKLVDVTGNYMNAKTRILDRVQENVSLESNSVQRFVNNLKKYEETKLWLQDKKYLIMKQSLKQTKDMIDRLDAEDVIRLKRVLDNTEKIVQTYKKMNLIVVQQAQIIDRIDYNLTLAVVHTHKANKELKKLYDSYNNSALFLQIAICGIILFFSVFLYLKIN